MSQVGRRHFLIAAVAMLGARLAHAQPDQKVYQIGVLQSVWSDVGGLSESFSLLGIQLAGHGYVRHYGISSPVKAGPSRRFSWVPKTAQESDAELGALAAELVRLKVDLVLAVGAPSATAAKRSTGTIPIVVLVQGDPVRLGLVASLGRPGSNITGVTAVASQLAVKRLELLKEAVPGLTRVAVIWNPNDEEQMDQWRAIGAAAQQMSIEPQSIGTSSASGLAQTLDALRVTEAGALLVFSNRFTRSNAAAIAEAAASHRIPAVYAERAFVSYLNGGLMSYGPVHVELLERTAKLMAQILDGAKPSELPVEQPSSFELVVNARSAKAIGLRIPPSILLRANQVLE